jgi:hypothetical protein
MISKKLARLATTAALGVTALAAPIAVAGSAEATTVHPAAVHEVCADSLYVREAPQGRMIGTLFRGEHFDFYYSNGNGWDYGYAYGGANQLGWVQAGWFC